MIQLLLGLVVLIAGGAIALLVSKWPRVANGLGAITAVAGAAISLLPVLRVLGSGASPNALSWAWNVPFGSFSVGLDALSAWFAAAILGLAILAAIYGAGYLACDAHHKWLGPPWFFTNLLVAAMVLVVIARNGVLFLVAWESMAIASYFLVTFHDERHEVREAGRIYLIASHVGTAFLVLFFGLFASQTGSLDFSVMAQARISGALSNTLTTVMFLLALVGFGTKAGFMPLHVWLPEAHPAAPSHVSALMSGVMIKTGIYGLLRALTFFGIPPAWWGWLLVSIGLSSGVLGVLFALAQHDLKRLLAYSSVENIGIITMGLGVGLLGLSAGSPELAALGFGGGLLHVVNHAMFKGLLFLGTGAVLRGTGTLQIDRLGGLMKHMPLTGATFFVGAVAICGLPPLNGFISEFLIYLSSLQALRETSLSAAYGSVLALATIGGLALIGGLAAACFTKALGMAFLGEPRTPAAAGARAPNWLMVVPMLVLAAGCLSAGLAIGPIFAALGPVLAIVLNEPVAGTATSLAPAFGSLSAVVTISWIGIALTVLLAALRSRLLRRRETGYGMTWDCGYAAPSAQMQYTSTSFVQPLTSFFSLVLRTRRNVREPTGLFPDTASAHTQHEDVFLTGLYAKSYRGLSWLLCKLHCLQHGRLDLYVLYIALTLVSLLAWQFGLGELLDSLAQWFVAEPTSSF